MTFAFISLKRSWKTPTSRQSCAISANGQRKQTSQIFVVQVRAFRYWCYADGILEDFVHHIRCNGNDPVSVEVIKYNLKGEQVEPKKKKTPASPLVNSSKSITKNVNLVKKNPQTWQIILGPSGQYDYKLVGTKLSVLLHRPLELARALSTNNFVSSLLLCLVKGYVRYPYQLIQFYSMVRVCRNSH